MFSPSELEIAMKVLHERKQGMEMCVCQKVDIDKVKEHKLWKTYCSSEGLRNLGQN